MSDAAGAPPARSGLLRAVMENLEALAIAIVMALILKYFLIEAYKIPTGSMQPTIMGDPVTGVFDRVLVNKLVYLVRDPRRYEVVVFKNPLWQRQNYIKRLVGFGGETITIRNGDVFVRPPKSAADPRPAEAIARKPDEVWRSVRKDIAPNADERVADYFHAEHGSPRFDHGRIEFAGPAGTAATVSTTEPVRDHQYDGYPPAILEAHANSDVPRLHDVGDVEIAADVTPRADAERIVFEIHEAGRVHTVTLPVGSGTGLVTSSVVDGIDPIEWEDQRADANVAALRRGATTRVDFRNVDDELVLEIGGRVVVRRPYLTRGVDADYDPKRPSQPLTTRISIVATGGFELDDVRLWRDVYYLSSTPDRYGMTAATAVFEVPVGEYMVLGDNTQNSHDCRQWEKATYDVKGIGKVSGNWFSPRSPWTPGTDANPTLEDNRFHFRSEFGEEYVFWRNQVENVDGEPEVVPVHSFKKEFLLGKALAVFWPLPPFSPAVRLKWVH